MTNVEHVFDLIEGDGKSPAKNSLAVIMATEQIKKSDPKTKFDPGVIVAGVSSRIVARLTGVSQDKIDQATRIGKSF